ncbi:MAG: hypothetical protein KDK36_21595 [Leptospiraceae bacterium]|nr:hypothetical protein [Leptospiraceae bacterium]
MSIKYIGTMTKGELIMLTINTVGTISEDGYLIVKLNEKLNPGLCNLVITLEEPLQTEMEEENPIIGLFKEDEDIIDQIANIILMDRESLTLRV